VQTFTEVEINISREKEFIILIIKNILERVSGFFTAVLKSLRTPAIQFW
jgi:hypothetical protein